MGRSSFQESKRVTFGIPLQIPCSTAESDEESLDINDVFVDAEDGSMTLDDLVQVADHSFCDLEASVDADCNIPPSRRYEKFFANFDAFDSTDITFSESETELNDPEDFDLVRKLESSTRRKEGLGSVAKKFASLLDMTGAEESAPGITVRKSPCVAVSQDDTTKPKPTAEQIESAKRQMAIRAAKKLAQDFLLNCNGSYCTGKVDCAYQLVHNGF